ncbi:hypothetical protein T4A_647 [Trichinella pseudospiralis]|uniref:Uncharacterized protein n=1 Tax=Trichinella pseudospiralis TaxID=6337 RepID=A0A0V1DLS8_TRIPS|nr:hypothetical protein T4A_647 [Trichinella pseudospiralis]
MIYLLCKVSAASANSCEINGGFVCLFFLWVI